MVNKLTPKPENRFTQKNWQDLDELLLSNFKPSKSRPSATIRLSDFEMEVLEIQEELSKAGYEFEVDGEFLHIK